MQGRVGFFHDFFGTNSADVGQVRAGRFRELGHRIFHDFLATQAAENTDAAELPIPPGRKCWPSQGRTFSRAGPPHLP